MDQTANQDKKSSRSSMNRNPFKAIKNKVNGRILLKIYNFLLRFISKITI